MKIFRAIAAVAFLAAISAGSVLAQPKPVTPAGPSPTPAQTATLPDTKIALIDSVGFYDEKQGITRFVAAVKQLAAEFQPRKTELQTLQTQVDKATADLQKAAPLQDVKVSQQQQDKIDQMTKDLKRKAEDAQAAFDRRQEEVLGPISENISKALEVYAQSRGITLVIDVRKLVSVDSQGNQQFPLLYSAPNIDITRAFINDYNSKNPATASLTPPK